MPAQQAITPVKFTTFRHPAPGYFVFAPNSPDSFALTDHSGRNILAVRSQNVANVQFTDSTITHFVSSPRAFLRRNGVMQVVDTLRLEGDYILDYHEGRMLSNGNYVVLGLESRTINMSALVPGGSSAARVQGAVIQERTLGGQTVFEWKSLDHIPVTDATEDIELFQPTIDYIHVNAIAEDTDGNFLVSCRHLDEIIKVHRTTGSVLWRWGGSKSKGNQFTFLNDNSGGFIGFSHQHDVSRTENGRILMLDNGNLKPTPFSRAAEYEINESLKTAKLTWSFRPTPDIYAKGMGSVQELENGNIVIGWGSESEKVLAHEVSRDGIIQAEIHSNGGAILAYRVRKLVFAMSGAERVINSTGTYTFTHGDSNTRVSVLITRADAPTSVITECHSVAPHAIAFVTTTPCVPLPMRWVIRVKDTSKIAGSTKFALGNLPMVIVPSQVKLYHRPKEGIGKFSEVATTYDAIAFVLVTAFVRPGEYLLAYPMCYDPVPTSPGEGTTQISLAPTLRWSEGLQTAGYDVELYGASGSTPLFSFRTFRLDTVVTGLVAGDLYTWRVRARRPNAGPWSAMYSFRTRLGTPKGTWPTSLPDSLAVELRPIFIWNAVSNATRYRLQIFALGTATPMIDTVVTSPMFQWLKPFAHHTWYSWQVRAQLDTQSSAWSKQVQFVTPPAPPVLVSPIPEELEVDTENTEATWLAVAGGILYDIRLFKDVLPDAIHLDTVAALQATFPSLAPVTRYYWQVRTLSRYGASEWTPRRWFLTRGADDLPAPVLLSPVGAKDVDAVNTDLTWSPVEGATFYHVELTSKSNFTNPDFEWFDVNGTTKLVSKLQSGRVYRWRVMGLSDVASGHWSTPGLFTTRPGPGDLLRPLTPIDGSTDVPTQGFASFVTDPSFTLYRAEFSPEPDFSHIAYSIEGSVSPLPYSLFEATYYWWRVVGLRNGLAIDTGLTAAFLTQFTSTSVVNSQTHGSPTITIDGGNLEVRGEVGGSSIQIFDVMGRLVLTSIVAAGNDFWQQSLTGLASSPHIVIITIPNGTIKRATFFVSTSRL
ncbi:MAG: aryl-sulfate sulfotransferase [bacterium]|nr:aryl-sulfate sulfotransferase [bacterium]